MHADISEYRQLDLRAHSLLQGIELHDVWLIELEGGGPGRTIEDVRHCFTPQTMTTANAAVRFLFSLRRWLGRTFRWDTEAAGERWDADLYIHRLTDDDRARTLVPPRSDEGLLHTVYVFPNEALSEIRNATVHAFSCLALRATMNGYRVYWAIYVKPISPWTRSYMRLIDPFRRAVVYPAVINRVRLTWKITYGG